MAPLREYHHLAVFCKQFFSTSVEAVVNTETWLGADFSLNLLRELCGLATLESREKLITVMSSVVFRRAMKDTIEDMCVEWH